MMRIRILVATTVSFVAMLQAAAASSPGAQCVGLKDDAVRLSCYDHAFNRDAPETTAPAATAPASRWSVEIEKSDFTDTKNVYMSVASTAPVRCRSYGDSHRIQLFVRCLENTTSLFISGDCHFASGFGGYGRVEFRLDDGKMFARNLNESTDHHALGLWSGRQSIPMIKQLFGKDRLLARMTPFSESPITAEFLITGLEDKIAPLREACHW